MNGHLRAQSYMTRCVRGVPKTLGAHELTDRLLSIVPGALVH